MYRFIWRECYACSWLFAKDLTWKGWGVLNPECGQISKRMKDYLNTKTYDCPNYCFKDNVSFKDLMHHFKNETCTGFKYDGRKKNEFEERINCIKKDNRWIEVTDDKINLRPDWDTYNAKWLICLYLADLDGYIWYGCTALSCKDHCEEYDKSVGFPFRKTYHPYGYRLWAHWKRYGMVKIERFPETYDQIFKFKILKCSNDWGKPPLYFQQMYQHEKVLLF